MEDVLLKYKAIKSQSAETPIHLPDVVGDLQRSISHETEPSDSSVRPWKDGF